MSIGLIITLILVGLLVLSGIAIAWLWNSRKDDKEKIKAYTNVVANQAIAISQRDALVKKLQEADNVANKQKDSMATGSVSDRVDASIDVLHDIAKPKTGTTKG
jgi:hypothetical protein